MAGRTPAKAFTDGLPKPTHKKKENGKICLDFDSARAAIIRRKRYLNKMYEENNGTTEYLHFAVPDITLVSVSGVHVTEMNAARDFFRSGFTFVAKCNIPVT